MEAHSTKSKHVAMETVGHLRTTLRISEDIRFSCKQQSEECCPKWSREQNCFVCDYRSEGLTESGTPILEENSCDHGTVR
jgi:hypothetical protein